MIYDMIYGVIWYDMWYDMIYGMIWYNNYIYIYMQAFYLYAAPQYICDITHRPSSIVGMENVVLLT